MLIFLQIKLHSVAVFARCRKLFTATGGFGVAAFPRSSGNKFRNEQRNISEISVPLRVAVFERQQVTERCRSRELKKRSRELKKRRRRRRRNPNPDPEPDTEKLLLIRCLMSTLTDVSTELKETDRNEATCEDVCEAAATNDTAAAKAVAKAAAAIVFLHVLTALCRSHSLLHDFLFTHSHSLDNEPIALFTR
ncbi:uncharacterized protein V6R79_017233 [Siganus canaliculatus]